MLPTNPNLVSTSAASYWARQFELCSALNAKALNSMTKLADLNMHAMQDALENSSKALQQMLAPDNPGPTPQAQLAIEGARAYGRQVANIAFEMRTESTHLVQGSITAVSAQIDACFDDLSKDAPDAASGVLQLMKVAIGNVNKGYDQLMMTSEQAAQAMVDSLDSAANPYESISSNPGGNSKAH
jgi:phasin family protein